MNTLASERWDRRKGRFIPPDASATLRIDYDGDPYGWASGHMFGICSALYVGRQAIPESWHYVTPRHPEQERESVEGTYPDQDWIDLHESGTLTAEQLRRTGAVLMRYLDRVRRAGRDY